MSNVTYITLHSVLMRLKIRYIAAYIAFPSRLPIRADPSQPMARIDSNRTRSAEGTDRIGSSISEPIQGLDRIGSDMKKQGSDRSIPIRSEPVPEPARIVCNTDSHDDSMWVEWEGNRADISEICQYCGWRSWDLCGRWADHVHY
jgi:hypothetical protein